MWKHPLSLVYVLTISATIGSAQDIQQTIFKATPLTLNPAFTGMTDGSFRANASLRNAWKATTVGYITDYFSVDAPLYTRKNGDYFGGGLVINQSVAGDGNLKNFAGLVSGSYHKLLGKDSARAQGRGSDLAIGLQAGYMQRSIDLSVLYFAPGNSTGYLLGMGNTVNYYTINAGASFSQSVNRQFNYTIGLSVNNLNQPANALDKSRNSSVGLDISSTGIAGCNVLLGKRLTISPAFIFEATSPTNYFIAGSEFSYNVGAVKGSTAVFYGLWYRSTDIIMVTAGLKAGRFRLGVAYDYQTSSLASNGGGGFEFAVSYINPGRKTNKRHLPCNRF
jgi:type IX secretion system PorP/SprF family membrane protein